MCIYTKVQGVSTLARCSKCPPPHFFPRRERLFARFLFLVMTTTEVSKFDRESTATSRRVEKRDFSNSFDDAERYRGDRVSNAFVKKLINQRKEIEEKWFAFEQQKWFDTQRNIQADQELEKMKREVEEKKREVEEPKFEAMTRMMTAQLQSRNYNRLGQISPYYGNSIIHP